MTFSPFTRIAVFVLLTLLGLSLLPYLPFKLSPTRSLPSLTLSFSWPDASAEAIELSATSRLEGLFAGLEDLEEISSRSEQGQGEITLRFDKRTDLDRRRLEVSSLVRRLIPSLPEDMSYPSLRSNLPGKDTRTTLMSYTLNGDTDAAGIQRYAERNVRNALAEIRGISRVNIYGGKEYAWEIRYEPLKLEALGLQVGQLEAALRRHKVRIPLGGIRRGDTYVNVQIEGDDSAFPDWKGIPLAKLGARIVYLGEVAEVYYVEKPAEAYYRINGLNSINIVLEADREANQLELASAVKERMKEVQSSLPVNFSLIETYDSTKFLNKELDKILRRSLLSLLVLTLFLTLSTFSFRASLVVMLSLLANLSIAVIFYYFLGLELHIYSLAGITISLGLVMDNSLVMVDHLRKQRDLRIFLALLGATLTTIAALSVVFLLPAAQRLILLDFGWVALINLAISLPVALWLVPALIHYIYPQASPSQTYLPKANMHSFYARYIRWGLRRKGFLITLALLGFGLPTFLLPSRLGKQTSYTAEAQDEAQLRWYEKAYNASLGTGTYQQRIKPWLDKALGGALRLFIEETYPSYRFREPERTRLYINGSMEYGTNIHQLNEAFVSLETYLAQFDEVEQYHTEVFSPQSANMVIYFKPEHERSSFPYILKSRVESFAIDLGAVDWSIYGVGLGFSNAIGLGSKNSNITLYGYNYDALLRHGKRLSDTLLAHPRIKEVFFNGERRWDYRPNFEYLLSLDREAMARTETNAQELYDFLRSRTQEAQRAGFVLREGVSEDILLMARKQETLDKWGLDQTPFLGRDSSYRKLRDLAGLERRPGGTVILRHNQEYQLLLEFDFIGPPVLQKKSLERFSKQANDWLPVGYRADLSRYYWQDNKDHRRYLLVALVIVIIYMICAVLLESLLQPLAVIALIPLSFIGVFLTFYLFKINFDQGGFASFLVLSGISVNSALYLLNDFNNLATSGLGSLERYLIAFRQKALPVGLTVLSTIAGLLPFLWDGADENFWYALAAGTVGGLLFSVLALWAFLPVFLMSKSEKQGKRNISTPS